MRDLCSTKRGLTVPVDGGVRTFNPTRAALGAMAVMLGFTAGMVGCDSSTSKKIEDGGILAAFGSSTRPVDAARDMNDPYDAGKRLRGMLLIANAPFGGEEVYVKGYVKALGGIEGVPADPDPGVRAVAARALSLHGRAEHVPLIIPLLDPANPKVARIEAARALQRLHNEKAVDPLIRASQPPIAAKLNSPKNATEDLGESETDVRAESCIALGQYAQTRVLQALIRGVDDDQLAVNRAAQQSLATLTGEKLGDDRKRWLAWLDKTKEPFANRTEYVYPVFSRDKTWVEYLPFVQPPPNETPASPAGMSAGQ